MIRRFHRYGLSSACIEGILSSMANCVAVMDVDGQHDEALLPVMYNDLAKSSIDVVVASRYVTGGSTGDLASNRVFISTVATRLAQSLSKTSTTDPMSGFFMLRRASFNVLANELFGQGFKILLDILLAGSGKLALKERPYKMRQRRYGESKLSAKVIVDYFLLLANHLLGRFLPLDFVCFVLVGVFGSLVHLSIIWFFLRTSSLSFLECQAIATFATISLNFYFNNSITFAYQRLRGKKLFKGLLKFFSLCGVGFLLNLSISQNAYLLVHSWVVAGLLGYSISGLWNYMCSKTSIWKS
ncbi:glycosyltransferase [Candidatus Finniella inopinata]|uniref:Glycosyltransferase n=1 Tax=Candidatus Finniella inopinata TaxID=1696036 RepID=A0A4Q7DGX7_9PROT|nr:glycosyltransferase [Candidatus Finniella inopinata]